MKGDDLNTALEAFVKLLVRDHKLKQAGKIIEEFERVVKKVEGIVELKITSARELDEATVESIKKAFGEKVEAVTSVEESMIGGVKVKLEDKILDGSIKTQLKTLKQSLI